MHCTIICRVCMEIFYKHYIQITMLAASEYNFNRKYSWNIKRHHHTNSVKWVPFHEAANTLRIHASYLMHHMVHYHFFCFCIINLSIFNLLQGIKHNLFNNFPIMVMNIKFPYHTTNILRYLQHKGFKNCKGAIPQSSLKNQHIYS